MNFYYPPKKTVAAFIAVACSCVPFIGKSQESDPSNLDTLNLEDLMSIKVEVASLKQMSTQESPSIVTLLTHEEIINSGARDVIDLLKMIPGIDFGMDTEGITGIFMRGNWSHEGKVLLMLDGLEMNELRFNTSFYGNRFDVSQIERIEIIRGPGSTIYGGVAEHGVINIITQNGNSVNGARINTNYGYRKRGYARENVGASFGKKWANSADFVIHAFGGASHLSEQKVTTPEGRTVDWLNNSRQNPLLVQTKFSKGNFAFKGLYENYRTECIQYGGQIFSKSYPVNFITAIGDAKYAFKLLNDRLQITPQFTFKHSDPWRSYSDANTNPLDSLYLFNVASRNQVTRLTPQVSVNYLGRKIEFFTGLKYTKDIAQTEQMPLKEATYQWNGQERIEFDQVTGYAQLYANTKIGRFNLGGRLDHHNVYGWIGAPRVGLTKTIDKFHLKALYSVAYRVPGLENMNASVYTTNDNKPALTPEKNYVSEIEVGYMFNTHLLVNLNVFDSKMKNTITFLITDEGLDGYLNYKQSGTRGVEAELKYKNKNLFVIANYSFYTAKGINRIDILKSDFNPGQLNGAPQHSLKVTVNQQLNKIVSISLNYIYQSEKSAYTSYDAATETYAQSLLPQVNMINLVSNFRLFKNTTLFQLGLYNLLNQKYYYVQPYDGGDFPIRTNQFEVMAKITHTFNLKQ